MSRDAFDVIGLGVTVRDVTVWLDHHPAPDEKLAAERFVESGGGPVPTALVTCARLGLRTRFVGLVGDDLPGHLVREALCREGVDTLLTFDPSVETPTSVILVVGPHRTICEWRQEIVPLHPEAIRPCGKMFDRARALHIDARMPDAQFEAARRTRANGGLVMLDAGHPRPGVDRLLPHVDVAVLSHTYPDRLPHRPPPERFLDEVLERMAPDGRRIAGLTLGERGCLVREDEGPSIRIPGHAVEAVDTTGAGDVFHGAFLVALLDGEEVEPAARFANAAAALKCRGRTGRAPLPPRAEIRELAGLS